MAENMSLLKLNERLQDPMAAGWIHGIFPRDTPRNMRFAINFFTSIGLGGVTDALRAHLKELPKLIAAQQGEPLGIYRSLSVWPAGVGLSACMLPQAMAVHCMSPLQAAAAPLPLCSDTDACISAQFEQHAHNSAHMMSHS